MKKLILTLSAFVALTTVSFAQSDTIKKHAAYDSDPSQVFTIVQQMPTFPGDMNKYLADNIHYPALEKKKGIQGTVYIHMVVEIDGTVANAKVIKGVENGAGLDAEAVRVINGMPKWKPGMQNGKPVRVAYNLPIRFVLQ